MQQNQIKSKSYGQAKQLNLFFDKDSVKSFDILYKELQIIKMEHISNLYTVIFVHMQQSNGLLWKCH